MEDETRARVPKRYSAAAQKTAALAVVAAAASAYGTTGDSVVGPSRRPPVVRARAATARVPNDVLVWTHGQIADLLQRDRSSVSTAVKKARAREGSDPTFRQVVEEATVACQAALDPEAAETILVIRASRDLSHYEERLVLLGEAARNLANQVELMLNEIRSQ